MEIEKCWGVGVRHFFFGNCRAVNPHFYISLLLGISCTVLNMTHSLSFKAVNDAEYHLIKIWFQKSKIKLISFSLSLSLSLSLGGGHLSQECVEKGGAVNAQFCLEVTEQLLLRLNRPDQSFVKTRTDLCCFMAEHLHIRRQLFGDFFHKKGLLTSTLLYSPDLALADFSLSKLKKEAEQKQFPYWDYFK
jgi:hypothetical protein